MPRLLAWTYGKCFAHQIMLGFDAFIERLENLREDVYQDWRDLANVNLLSAFFLFAEPQSPTISRSPWPKFKSHPALATA